MNRLTLLALPCPLTVIAALGSACSSSPGAPTQNAVSPPSPDAGDDSSGDDGSQGDDAAATTSEFDAVLSGAQLAPPVRTTAAGAAKFVLQSDGATVNYDVMQNVAGATAVNVHLGAIGEEGDVIHSLTPVSTHMTGSFALDASKGEADALAAGMLYVDVMSSVNTSALRGQLVAQGATIFVALPAGSQETPPVTSAHHAHASFILSADQATIRYHFVTDATPTDVRLHRGIGGTNGPVAFPLSIGQAIDGTVQIGTSDADDLAGARMYINIVTAANQAGELRGQIILPGETLLPSALTGTSEVPPVSSQATGGAQAVLSYARDRIRYEAVVSGIIPTAAELDNAPPGQNGPTLFSLTLDGPGARGTTAVTSAQADTLVGGRVYVNVRTESYSSGELRGQLLTR